MEIKDQESPKIAQFSMKWKIEFGRLLIEPKSHALPVLWECE